MNPAPYDESSENALIGALLAGFPDAISFANERLTAGDFHQPAAQATFAAIVSLFRAGHRVELVSVVDESRRLGEPVDPARLKEFTSSAGGGWRRYVDVVLRDSSRRDLLRTLSSATDGLRDLQVDPGAVVDNLVDVLGSSRVIVGEPPRDLYDLDAACKLGDSTPASWVIPGMLRRGWRAVLVGFEGRGKSVLLTQMASLTAHGIHPFTHVPCTPQTTLLIDLENPAELLSARLRALRVPNVQGNVHVWHRPQGFNLRQRGTRAELEATLAKVRPSLVCMGPLYKAYRLSGRESDEQAAVEVQGIIDDFRSRYGFALVVEHHAPHAEPGGKRRPRPYGSSLWLRWPEFGIGLEDHERAGSLKVGRFRGDRVNANWPDRIDRSKPYPWVGFWLNSVEGTA